MIHAKQAGSWLPTTIAWIRRSGSWTYVRGIFVRVAGVWTLAYMPQIALSAGTVRLNNDGTITYVGYFAGEINWFGPASAGTPGIGSFFWVRVTKTSGVGHANVDDGGWHSLAAGLLITNVGAAGASTSLLEISTNSGGTDIMSTGTILVNNAI